MIVWNVMIYASYTLDNIPVLQESNRCWKKQLLWLIIFIATIVILAICFNDTINSTNNIELDVSSIFNAPLSNKKENKVTVNIFITIEEDIISKIAGFEQDESTYFFVTTELIKKYILAH